MILPGMRRQVHIFNELAQQYDFPLSELERTATECGLSQVPYLQGKHSFEWFGEYVNNVTENNVNEYFSKAQQAVQTFLESEKRDKFEQDLCEKIKSKPISLEEENAMQEESALKVVNKKYFAQN